MKCYRHYTTIEKERKVFMWTLVIIAVLLLALFVLELCGVLDQDVWKPVESFPMANQHIEWEYAGRT